MTTEDFKRDILKLQPRMQRTAECIVGDPDSAADAVQEAVIALWEQRAKMESRDLERLGLTIVKRRSIDMLRRQKPLVSIEAEKLMQLEVPAEVLLEEHYQLARKLVNQLPERQRDAILMKYEEGLSNKEIEKATGMSSTHLYATLSRVYKTLRNTINQRITRLVINPGWDVHLIHHEADSGYRVAIITEEDLAARAYNVQLCNVKDQTLTILENTQLPRGTVVEIEGPMTFWQILLLNNATAEADYVLASAAAAPKDLINLNLSKNSSFHVQHYHIPNPDNSPGMEIWDQAQLTIDTISGEGNVMMNVYEGDFQYGSDILRGKITLNEYGNTSDWPYMQGKDSRVIKTKEVDGELVTTDRIKIWNDALVIDVGIGEQYGNTPTNPNSPFLQYNTLTVNMGFST